MTPLQRLIDERRTLQAKVAGKDLEICMALNDRDGAKRALREMAALILARRAAQQAAQEGER